jgi:hypothetical protein
MAYGKGGTFPSKKSAQQNGVKNGKGYYPFFYSVVTHPEFLPDGKDLLFTAPGPSSSRKAQSAFAKRPNPGS